MDAARIVDLLPEVFRRAAVPGQPLDLLVGVMEELHAPVEEVLGEFDAYIDPYRCPDAFVPYLAHWVGLGWLVVGGDHPVGDGPLRALVATAERLANLRGTAVGMSAFLVLATGTGPFEVGTGRDAFHLLVRGPAAARPLRGLVEQIVRHEKPAFTSASIALGDEDQVHLGRRWIPAPAPQETDTAARPPHPEPPTGEPDA